MGKFLKHTLGKDQDNCITSSSFVSHICNGCGNESVRTSLREICRSIADLWVAYVTDPHDKADAALMEPSSIDCTS